jgi:ATP-binding cassette subfamily F protein uup
LVLDEPTNDLDAETLELLEELLLDFQGTILLVSHDRALLDNVVTGTLVLEGEGRVRDYVGGYSDWLRQRDAAAALSPARGPAQTQAPQPAQVQAKPQVRKATPAKLSFKEERELAALPGRIESLEAEQGQLQTRLADPGLYQQGGDAVTATQARLAQVEAELAAVYDRWEALEAVRGA